MLIFHDNELLLMNNFQWNFNPKKKMNSTLNLTSNISFIKINYNSLKIFLCVLVFKK
jgi:hypothetical protein